jgi:hypothetical protein
MNPGDVLAARVREYVATQVAPESVDLTTQIVGQTLSALMADPTFTCHLRVVQELLQEIQWLKTQVIHQQRILALSVAGTSPGKKPRKRAAAAKKATPRTTSPSRTTASSSRTPTTPSRRAATPAQRAFTKGFKQARR